MGCLFEFGFFGLLMLFRAFVRLGGWGKEETDTHTIHVEERTRSQSLHRLITLLDIYQ